MPFTPDELAEIQTIVRQQQQPIALDGFIVAGSWDPTDGTAEFVLGDTLSLPIAPGQSPIAMPRFQVLVPAVGEQTGPLGGERACLVRRQSGWAITLEHGEDDSPNAAAGEWVKRHIPSGAQMALRNDNVAGDGKGSFQVDGTAAHKMTTAGGLGRTADDHAETIVDTAGTTSTTLDKVHDTVTHATSKAQSLIDGANQAIKHTVQGAEGQAQSIIDGANQAIEHTVGTATAKLDAIKQLITHSVGNTSALVDGEGNAISLVAGVTGLGDLASTLSTNPLNAVIAKTHLDTGLANVDAQFLTNSSVLVTALNTHGAFQSGFNLATFLPLLISGFFDNITKAAGSASVFTKL